MGGVIDSVTADMILCTEAKFTKWDEVVSKGWLNGDEEQRKYSYSLLADPTIYAYAFFRKPGGDPVTMWPYQDVILNDKGRKIIFVAANQIGKSFCLCVKAIHFALLNPGVTVLMTSKTFTQSKELLLQIKNILNLSVLDYKYDVGEFETKTKIYFKHYEESINDDGESVLKELKQSRIICVPATEAALGYAVDLLLEDELAFYEDGRYFHFQIAQPRTYATKGKIIVFSNPNGRQGVFWELYNSEEYSKYRFNFLDRPGNTVEEYEALRKSLTREEFDSTVNAEFTSPEGGFLSLAERRSIQKNRPNYLPGVITQPLYVFFDFAKSKDRTVRSIGIPVEKNGVISVYVHELKEYPLETGYNVIIDDLKQLISDVGSNNVFMVGWDNTGVGRGVEDFIKSIEEIGIMCTPVEFSAQNKSRIYTLFKLLVEQNRIDIPYVDECDIQFSKLRFKKTSGRGYLLVHHESEKDRDDYPDSIVGLCSLILGPDNVPVTLTLV